MKNLELLEITNQEARLVEGGSWLGELVGTMVGAAVRYSGPTGVNNACADISHYMAKK